MKTPWKVDVEMAGKKLKQPCLSGSGKFTPKKLPKRSLLFIVYQLPFVEIVQFLSNMYYLFIMCH